MFAGVFDAHTQFATASVEVKGADLEYALGLSSVEIAERNKVVQQSGEVATITSEPVHRRDRVGLWLERLVLGNQRGDGIFAGPLKQLSNAFQSEFLD